MVAMKAHRVRPAVGFGWMRRRRGRRCHCDRVHAVCAPIRHADRSTRSMHNHRRRARVQVWRDRWIAS